MCDTAIFCLLLLAMLSAGQPAPDLPQNHLPYFYSQFPGLRPAEFPSQSACWGYEPDCRNENRFSRPVCRGNFAGWARNRREAEELFYQQADFGYVKQMLAGSHSLCKSASSSADSSQLICAKELQYCLAKNILVDFRALVPRIKQESLR